MPLLRKRMPLLRPPRAPFRQVSLSPLCSGRPEISKLDEALLLQVLAVINTRIKALGCDKKV